ncbi:MAG: 3-hydroxyacyl-[acyl-carrier-protein] dehydratase [Patiriisocius sp.]|jgi:3-hydroxyacyl-[acyl-carrier-protein] dehydratase
MQHPEIIAQLPYSDPFLFVDTLDELNEDGAVGTYQFKKDAYFYQGHFKGLPVTPGVLLTECMAQIGLVSLGIFLLKKEVGAAAATNTLLMTQVAMSNTTIDFFKTVMPGETVIVASEKVYFRFGKLRCKVSMFTQQKELIAKGTIDGMVVLL